MQAIAQGHSIAAPAYNGSRGHPVAFAARWYELLQKLEGDAGARRLWQNAPEELYQVPVDDVAVVRDIDTRQPLVGGSERYPPSAPRRTP